MFIAQLPFLYSCIVQGHKLGSNAIHFRAGSPHISGGSHDTPAQTCTQGTPSSRQSLAETLFPGHSTCAKLTVEAGHAKSLFAAGNKKELSNSGTVIPFSISLLPRPPTLKQSQLCLPAFIPNLPLLHAPHPSYRGLQGAPSRTHFRNRICLINETF